MYGDLSSATPDRPALLAFANPMGAAAFAALAALGNRVRVAVGADSGQEVAARGGCGLAQRLGREVDVSPGHHAGFTSAEGDFPGQPGAFAARLREVLA